MARIGRKRRSIQRTVRQQTSQRGAGARSDRPTFTTNTRRTSRSNRSAANARTKRISSAVKSQMNASPWQGPRRVDISSNVSGAIRSGVKTAQSNFARHRTSLSRGRQAFVRWLGADIRL